MSFLFCVGTLIAEMKGFVASLVGMALRSLVTGTVLLRQSSFSAGGIGRTADRAMR